MHKNYSERYKRISYNDRYKGIIVECLNFSLKHFTTEIFYPYFRTCFEINPKLLLTSLLETTHLTILTFLFLKRGTFLVL